MSNAGHVSGKVAVVTGGAHVWAPHTFVPGARRCDRRCDRHNRRPRSLPGRAVAVGGKRRLLLPPRCHQPRRVGSRGGERPAGARPDRRARQQRRRAGQIDGNRSRRSRMGPVGTRRAYTNPCLGSGGKRPGPCWSTRTLFSRQRRRAAAGSGPSPGSAWRFRLTPSH